MATWNFTISDTYAEHAGPEGVEKLVRVLKAGAEFAPGRSRAEIHKALVDAAAHEDIKVAPPELDTFAENLTLHDLEAVRVSDDSGVEIAHLPVANDVANIPQEERSDNVHLEPNDPRRPNIS